uniref:N-acetyltransferase domain-containing protein n=2 Tax=Macrostomum lignano TaxID=282301 RepID=A0A1I8F9X9_9PLAT
LTRSPQHGINELAGKAECSGPCVTGKLKLQWSSPSLSRAFLIRIAAHDEADLVSEAAQQSRPQQFPHDSFNAANFFKDFAGYDKKMSVVRVEENGLVYRNATMADTEAVWQLMVAEFYPRTELCCCLRMRIPQDVEILHTLLPAIIRHGVSLVVEDSASGKLVAARPTTVEQLTEQCQSRHPLLTDSNLAAAYSKCSAVYRMFDHLSCSVDLAKLYKVDRAISFKFLVVAESHSRRGIGKRLVELSLELAARIAIPLATTCTASRYSERIYSSMDFDLLSTLRLSEFVDPIGNQKHPLVADPGTGAAKYPKYSIIFRMFDQRSLVTSTCSSGTYNADTVMAFKFLVHAGRGIAKELVQFSLEVAKDWQLQVTSVITGNKYSERIYDGLKIRQTQPRVLNFGRASKAH